MGFSRLQYEVVLVWPPTEVVVESFDHPDYPHIGLAYIGNFLEKKIGVTPAIIDARLSRYTEQATVEAVINLRPRIVGISAMTHMVVEAAALAGKIKERLPDVSIVLGGIHATFLPSRTLNEFPVFDFVVTGEGETAFSELVHALLEGKPFESIPGLCFRKSGGIICNKSAPAPDDLDDLGEPGWHLFDQTYIRLYCRKIPLITQRGCPFSCNFCSRPYGRKNRRRSPEMVIDEVYKNVSDYGISDIWVFDENFTVNKDHVTAVCREILEKRIEIKWECGVHVNTIDDDLAKLMRDAGCWRVGFGVESGNDGILALMKKGINKERILNAHSVLKKQGFITTSYFILGHPNETKRTIWDTIRFAVRLNSDQTAIGIMVPYPGTEVWEMATAGKGGYRKLSPNWGDYNKQLGNAVELEHVSRSQLELAQVLGYSLIYIANLRFRDFWKMILENRRLVCGIIVKIVGLGRPNLNERLFRRG